MATDQPERRYRITPWAIRVGAPLAALVVIAGLVKTGAVLAVPIPIILAAAWVSAAERCGLVVTDDGIESRMTHRDNRFHRAWADIDGFELADNGAQVAIVMRLRDGSTQILPSTRSWFWDKRAVSRILWHLVQDQTAGEHI